jgi:PTH2 family peptidyl-tRNA hydrolase
MENRKTKMVLVWRNDLKVRRGKYGAQVAHASVAVLVNAMRTLDPCKFILHLKKGGAWDNWLNGRFTKIVVKCKDEAELLSIYAAAQSAKIPSILITDAGLTEFKGNPTNTCVGIGPFWADEIDKITSHLELD